MQDWDDGSQPFAEPKPGDGQSMRTQWNRMTTPSQLKNAGIWLDNRKVMPSIPASIKAEDLYSGLYKEAGKTVGAINTALAILEQENDPRQPRVKVLYDSVNIAATDIYNMRRAGYENTKYRKVLGVHGRSKIRSIEIKEGDNGGIKKARELDIDAMRAVNSKTDMVAIDKTIDAHSKFKDTESYCTALHPSKDFTKCV